MKKSVLAVLCLFAMTLTACSQEDTSKRAEQDVAELMEKTATVAPNPTETATPTATPTIAPKKLELEGKIFDSSKSSMKNLIPLGQWTSIKRYNAVSSTKELCYIRVNKVITDTAKVNKMVDECNKQDQPENQIAIEDKYKKEIEFVGVEYEIGYPAEWTTRDGQIAIQYANAKFAAKNMDGKVGFPAPNGDRYIGAYSTTVSLDKHRDERVTPGSIVKFHDVFQMVKGFDNYCLKLDLEELYFKIK